MQFIIPWLKLWMHAQHSQETNVKCGNDSRIKDYSSSLNSTVFLNFVFTRLQSVSCVANNYFEIHFYWISLKSDTQTEKSRNASCSYLSFIISIWVANEKLELYPFQYHLKPKTSECSMLINVALHKVRLWEFIKLGIDFLTIRNWLLD